MESERGANSGGSVKTGLAGRCHCSGDLKAEQEPAGEGSLPELESCFGSSLHQSSKEVVLWTVSPGLLARYGLVLSGCTPRD